MEPHIDNEARRTETLDRLCKHLVVKSSYAVLGVVDGDTVRAHGMELSDGTHWSVLDIPELAPLCPHFDRILVRSDGYAFNVICVGSRWSGASKPFTVTLDDVRQVGQTCLKYTGKIQGNKMPVTIQIVEVHDSSQSNIEHLQTFRCVAGLKKKVAVSAWALNVHTRSVWTNTKFNGLFAGRRFWERMLSTMVSGSDPTLKVKGQIGVDNGPPLLTYGLVAVMAVFFILELILGDFTGLLSPTVESLVAMGGLFKPAVMEEGEWYRLFTAAFLHGGLIHIVLNGFALVLGGIMLESWIGRGWFLTIFVLSILGGSAASLLINAPGIVSVGASGAIMGMLATALMVTFRLPYGTERTTAMTHLIYWLVPALIPLTTSRTGSQIDFAAHFGGAITGFLLGAFILKTWASDQPLPRFRRAAMVTAGMGAVAIVTSMVMAFSNRSDIQKQFALSAQIADDEAFRTLSTLAPDEAEARLAKLRKNFPGDPRSHFYSALYAVDRNQMAEAKAYLTKGLSEKEMLSHFFSNGKLEVGMRVLFAEILLFEHSESEARKLFKPACGRFAEIDVKRLDPAWVKAVCAP